jgi:uroporphyrinogen decarboxylase
MGIGTDLDFIPGPVIRNPVRNRQDVKNLKPFYPDRSTPFVGEILRLIRREIEGRVPVIGFAGAPFTLACYLVEGGNSKLFSKTIKFFFDNAAVAHQLMEKLTNLTIDYLNYQIENGAQLVQLFDTWAGILAPDEFREFIFPYVSKIFANLHQKNIVPSVYYINGSCHLLTQMAETGADVIGLDWRTDIGQVKSLIGDKVALQGNLDPNILFCSPAIIQEKTSQILAKYGPESGHIFNLGHGIDKKVRPDHLKTMVETVKQVSLRKDKHQCFENGK